MAQVLLQARQLAKAFGGRLIFDDVSFLIHSGEKVGLVGPNGAGKSTLFRCLTGQEEADEGKLFVSQGLNIGYLAQLPQVDQELTVFAAAMAEFASLLEMRRALASLEEEMSRPEIHQDPQQLQERMTRYGSLREDYEEQGGHSCESRAKGVLRGLGFTEEDWQKPWHLLSGGQKTRVNLARLLLREPQLLLLDEPTNHLDLGAVEWLEDYLQGYRGAVLVISHDRYFLDRIVTRVLDLSHGRLAEFPGNYSRFLELKEARLSAEQKAWEKDQAVIAKEEEYIRRNRAGVNSKQARGRETRLNRRERAAKPLSAQTLGQIDFVPKLPSAEQVLILEELAMGYDKPLFSDAELVLRRGECAALIGPNGVGKSTLFKGILGSLQPLTGFIHLGSRVRVGHFAQEHETLHPDYTVLQELISAHPMSEEAARNLLGRFLFRGDDVFKRVGVLSGGERGRLALAKLLLDGANFLLLDEPTNHLDIDAKEVLEEALSRYSGTMLVISHDRYFLDRMADRILELDEGRLTDYPGNYSEYRLSKAGEKAALQEETRRQEEVRKQTVQEVQPAKPSHGLNPFQIKKALAEIEELIPRLEAEKEALAERLGDQELYADGDEVRRVTEAFEVAGRRLEEAYARWELLLAD